MDFLAWTKGPIFIWFSSFVISLLNLLLILQHWVVFSLICKGFSPYAFWKWTLWWLYVFCIYLLPFCGFSYHLWNLFSSKEAVNFNETQFIKFLGFSCFLCSRRDLCLNFPQLILWLLFILRCIVHLELSFVNFTKQKWYGCQDDPVQFSSVAQSCPSLCDPMNRSMPGLPVHHQLPEFTQTHVHPVSDAIQPSHPLSSPSPPAPNRSQHQSLFQWVNSSHEVARVLEFQL